jgi:hypothetical protein
MVADFAWGIGELCIKMKKVLHGCETLRLRGKITCLDLSITQEEKDYGIFFK